MGCPKLLVDPANRWLTEITRPGPQIITGMRDAAKTMLLRALDIHAAQHNGRTKRPRRSSSASGMIALSDSLFPPKGCWIYRSSRSSSLNIV